MALIRKMEKTTLKVERVHGEVGCTYTVFQDNDRRRYFQVDTYGSPDRKLKGKKSQSLQFDEDTARELVALLKAEFGLR